MAEADHSLLAAWIDQRDADAFKTLAGKYAGMIFATCRRVLANPHDAEDVAQDCFETLARLRSVPRAPLGPWLHRVATNKALNVLKASGRRRNREAQYQAHSKTTSEPVWDDIYQFVDEAVAELPEQTRVPLVLHFFENQSYTAIGDSLGLTRQAATHRITQGIVAVREFLKRRGITVSAAALTGLLTANASQAVAVPASVSAAIAKIAISGAATAGGAAGSGFAFGTVSKLVAGVLIAAACTAGFYKLVLHKPPVQVAFDSSEVSPPAAPAEQPNIRSTVDPQAPEPATPETQIVDNIIFGRVLNVDTREPIGGTVTLSGDVLGGRQPIDMRIDEQGRFQFHPSFVKADGTFRVEVRNYHYYPFPYAEGVRRAGEPIPELLIEVKELPTISGRVFLADGTPVEASIMRVLLGNNSDTEAAADEHGNYVVHHDGGRWQLYARLHHLQSEPISFELARSESVVHDFVLPQGGGFTLELATADGGDVHDVFTSILMTEGVTAPYLWAEPLGGNRFEAKYLPYDIYDLEIRTDNYESVFVNDITIDEANPNPVVRATLYPAKLYHVTIRVEDEHGRPVAGAGVGLRRFEERLDEAGNVQAVIGVRYGQRGPNTNAAGEWTRQGIPAGIYQASASHGGGSGAVEVSVPQASPAVVRLSDSDPNKIYYDLHVFDLNDNRRELVPTDLHRFFVHDDMTVSNELYPGQNLAVIIKEGYTAWIESVSAPAVNGDEPMNIDAFLGEPGLIRGAGPAAGVALEKVYVFPVRVWPNAQAAWDDDWKNLGSALAQGARFDASGAFAVDYLPTGDYVIAASPNLYSTNVSVIAGHETDGVHLVPRR